MVAAENWCVKVDGRVYGPYTTAQMSGFAREGRLAATSVVAPAGARDWREAAREPSLSHLFRSASDIAFGRREAHAGANGETEPTAFVVVFDVVCATASRLETIVRGLGPATRLTDNVWAVTCPLTATGVRNAIAPHLRPRECVFVAEATRGTAAWEGFAPEVEVKLKSAVMYPARRMAAAS